MISLTHFGSNGTAICKVFMRNGRNIKVDTSTNHSEVTCPRCQKKMHAVVSLALRDRSDRRNDD